MASVGLEAKQDISTEELLSGNEILEILSETGVEWMSAISLDKYCPKGDKHGQLRDGRAGGEICNIV